MTAPPQRLSAHYCGPFSFTNLEQVFDSLLKILTFHVVCVGANDAVLHAVFLNEAMAAVFPELKIVQY